MSSAQSLKVTALCTPIRTVLL